MMLFNIHPQIDICMKRKIITIKPIRFLLCERLDFLFRLTGILCTAFGDIKCPVTYDGTSSTAVNGNTYFKCVSIVLWLLCRNNSVKILACYCYYITIP